MFYDLELTTNTRVIPYFKEYFDNAYDFAHLGDLSLLFPIDYLSKQLLGRYLFKSFFILGWPIFSIHNYIKILLFIEENGQISEQC